MNGSCRSSSAISTPSQRRILAFHGIMPLRLRVLVGRVYEELGDFAKAAKSFEDAAEITTELGERIKYETAAALFHARSGRFSEAASIFEGVKRRVQDNLELQV